MKLRIPTQDVAGKPDAEFWDGFDFHPHWVELSHKRAAGKAKDEFSREQGILWRCTLRGRCYFQSRVQRYLLHEGVALVTSQRTDGQWIWPEEGLPWAGMTFVFRTEPALSAIQFVVKRFGPVQQLDLSSAAVQKALALTRLLQKRVKSPSEWSIQTHEWFHAWWEEVERQNKPLSSFLKKPPEDLDRSYFANGNLKSFAEAVGYSQFHLSRKLKELWGGAPGKILKDAKLKQVAEEIRTTRIPIGDIARKFGYLSPSAFSRAFRKCYQMTPEEYRRSSPSTMSGK